MPQNLPSPASPSMCKKQIRPEATAAPWFGSCEMVPRRRLLWEGFATREASASDIQKGTWMAVSRIQFVWKASRLCTVLLPVQNILSHPDEDLDRAELSDCSQLGGP